MSQEKDWLGTEGQEAMTADEIEKHIATLVQCEYYPSTREFIVGQVAAGRAHEAAGRAHEAAGRAHEGVEDYEVALRRYRDAIRMELSNESEIYVKARACAQNNLGRMYANGWGVEQDFSCAYMWFHLAATQGLDEGIKNCEKMEKIMDAEEIARAKRMAEKCREQNYRGF